MRKKKNTAGRMEKCAERLCTNPADNKGKWLETYSPDGKYKKLHVEIGCGKGGFVVGMAKRCPDTLFVAIERVVDVILMALEKAKEEETENIVFLSANAFNLLDYFAPGEIDTVYLNFSDPWPKYRHARRRLSAPGFLKMYHSLLADDGLVRQKTDNDDLFAFSLESVPANGFELLYVTHDLHNELPGEDILPVGNVITEYERNFSEKGKNINMLVARKINDFVFPETEDIDTGEDDTDEEDGEV